MALIGGTKKHGRRPLTLEQLMRAASSVQSDSNDLGATLLSLPHELMAVPSARGKPTAGVYDDTHLSPPLQWHPPTMRDKALIDPHAIDAMPTTKEYLMNRYGLMERPIPGIGEGNPTGGIGTGHIGERVTALPPEVIPGQSSYADRVWSIVKKYYPDARITQRFRSQAESENIGLPDTEHLRGYALDWQTGEGESGRAPVDAERRAAIIRDMEAERIPLGGTRLAGHHELSDFFFEPKGKRSTADHMHLGFEPSAERWDKPSALGLRPSPPTDIAGIPMTGSQTGEQSRLTRYADLPLRETVIRQPPFFAHSIPTYNPVDPLNRAPEPILRAVQNAAHGMMPSVVSPYQDAPGAYPPGPSDVRLPIGNDLPYLPVEEQAAETPFDFPHPVDDNGMPIDRRGPYYGKPLSRRAEQILEAYLRRAR